MDVEEEEVKERRKLELEIGVMMVDCAKNMVKRCQGGGRAESGARTVSRPKLIVPTNLQMAIVGDGIVNVEGIMCGPSWNGWRGARLEMLQSIGDAVQERSFWCCCHSYCYGAGVGCGCQGAGVSGVVNKFSPDFARAIVSLRQLRTSAPGYFRTYTLQD